MPEEPSEGFKSSFDAFIAGVQHQHTEEDEFLAAQFSAFEMLRTGKTS